MPLNDDALTDIGSVRSWLGESDADQEAIELAINGISRSIKWWTGRQLAPPELAVVKRFAYDGEGILDLTTTELKGAPTSITLWADLPTAEQVVLVAGSASVEGEYRLEPRNGTEEGTYLSLVLPRVNPKTIASGRGYEPSGDDKLIEVAILGDWGADQIPGDVRLACTEEAAARFRNPEGVDDRSVGPYATRDTDDGTFGLSKFCRERLRAYKRTNIS